MKRSTVALITAGLILGGTGVVEILGTDTAASAPVSDRAVSVVAPARVSDPVDTETGHRYPIGTGTAATGP
ncbi:hypothetical protein [Nocardia carnea]|uniref:hypothetical protein n=1 Tax=Nocardia carnea TaxID=37328 RepID=UPI002455F148|nr:hypothetical protein [Nocardia carnea]